MKFTLFFFYISYVEDNTFAIWLNVDAAQNEMNPILPIMLHSDDIQIRGFQ